MTPEEKVLDSFHRIREAFFTADRAALQELVAHDYYGINVYGGIDNRDMMLEAYSPGKVTLEKFDVADLQVRIYGIAGIVTGKGYLCGTYGGDWFEHHLRFCDIYVCRNNRWQLIISQGTPMPS